MSKKYKVMLIVPLTTLKWGTKSAGGVDSVSQMLVKHLQENPSGKFHYRVVAFDPGNSCGFDRRTIRLNKSLEIVHLNVSNSTSSQRIKLPGLLYQLKIIREQIKAYKPDLIHTHLLSWGLTSINIPTIVTLHSYKKIGRTPRSFMNNILYEKIIPAISPIFSDSYTCVSQYLSEVVKKDYQARVTTIYNPIDERFLNHNTRSHNQRLTLVTCASLTENKGIHHIIEVVDLLKDSHKNIRLLVIGAATNRDYTNRLKILIKQKGLESNVIFLGPKNIYDLIHTYSISDIGVFLSAEETFGLVPLEMLASGLPVICTKTGVIADFSDKKIQLGALEVVKPGNYEEIANKVNNIKTTKSNESINFIKDNFAVKNAVQNYESEYDKVLYTFT